MYLKKDKINLVSIRDNYTCLATTVARYQYDMDRINTSRVDYSLNDDVYSEVTINEIPTGTILAHGRGRSVKDNMSKFIDVLFNSVLLSSEFYALDTDLDGIEYLINTSSDTDTVTATLDLYNTSNLNNGFFGDTVRMHTKLTITYRPGDDADEYFMRRLVRRIRRRTSNKNRLIRLESNRK